jgi:hypothetical protein
MDRDITVPEYNHQIFNTDRVQFVQLYSGHTVQVLTETVYLSGRKKLHPWAKNENPLDV